MNTHSPQRIGGIPLAQAEGLPARRVEPATLRRDVSDSDIGTGNFTQGVPAFWFARSLDYQSAETLYRPFSDSVWVQRGIKKVSQPISSVSVRFSRAAGEGPRRAGPEPVELSPAFLDFLREPAAGLGWEDFVEASVGWLKMVECFWLLDDSYNVRFPEARTEFPKVIVARPDRMRPQIEQGRLAGWTYTPVSGQTRALLPEQVIRLINWNPYDDWRGLGEYASAGLAAESDWLAGKFARNLMANNGDLGGIVIDRTGALLTNEQREQVISELRAKRAAQLRGELRYTFMTGDVDLKDPKITSVDAPFISQRLENRHEIAAAFGVPMSMFDIKASYSIGMNSDYCQLIFDTCIPTGRKLCAALDKLVFRMTGERVRARLNWDEHYVMQSIRRERLASADSLWAKGMPMRDVSEYLDLELPRFPGDHVGYVPVKVRPIAGENDEGARPPASPEKRDSEITDEEQPEVTALFRALGENRDGHEQVLENHTPSRAAALRLYHGKTGKIIVEFRVAALKRLSAQSNPGRLFDAEEFVARLKAELEPVAGAVVQTAASELLAEIGKKNDSWHIAAGDVAVFIQGRLPGLRALADTARSRIDAAIEAAPVSGIADALRAVFNQLQKVEAKRLAIMETEAVYRFVREKQEGKVG